MASNVTMTAPRAPGASPAPAASPSTLQGRSVQAIQTQNAGGVSGQIASVIKALVLSTAAVAITAITAWASILLTVVLTGVSPLTLIATIPLSFSLMASTIRLVAVPLLINANESFSQVTA